MTKNILVIDDEETVCSFMSAFLGGKGYAVLTAKHGKDGLESAQRLMPDLILLDINMPQMDGFAVLKTLKDSEKTRHIPVVMLTVHRDEEAKLKSWCSDAEDYISKPFDLEELDAKITQILGTTCRDEQTQKPKLESTTTAPD